MRKSIITLSIIAIVAGAISTSAAQEPDKKSEKARENIKEGKKDLKIAQKDSVTEFKKFKKESEEKIAANEKSIVDFKTKIAKEKKETRAANEKKIAKLEQKNVELKKKLESYKEGDKEKWDKFKTEFNHDMDELGKALKDFMVKNTK